MTFNHLPASLSELKRKNLDGRRVYETPAGKFPSVTSITSLSSRDSIMQWRKRVGEKEANKISTKAFQPRHSGTSDMRRLPEQ